ncbi:MAG: hypothetical protein IKE73_03180 [Bacilli bacterium]|nr:hypothetical protein [Bacilli bacterium]
MNREIDNIVMSTHESMKLNKINDNLYLSKKQMITLDNYKIDYRNKTIEELLFEIENVLEDSYDELLDLEELSIELAEFNYYHNTKK